MIRPDTDANVFIVVAAAVGVGLAKRSWQHNQPWHAFNEVKHDTS